MQRVSRVLCMGLIATSCAAGSSRAGAAEAPSPSPESRLAADRLGRLPLAFEANLGQFDRRVRFVARGRNETAFLTDDGLVLVRSGGATGTGVALRFGFEGAKRRARPHGLDPLPGRTNYLIGNKPGRWHTDVPHYARVLRRDAYPGIDVAYYQGKGGIEYDLIVAPGADPSRVRLAIEGADRIELADDGDLVLHTPLGELRQHRPLVYQGERAAPELVDARYRLASPHGTEVRIELGAYDPTRALVLDPTLDFGTYFGGAQNDIVAGIGVDSQNAVYLGGTTLSDATTFPETVGAYQTAKAAQNDLFVAKLSADGSQLLYATYVGGGGFDKAYGFAVDASGQAVISGDTTSTNFPTVNAVEGTKTCLDNCGMVSKLNAAGNGLVFSTYLGSTSFTRVIAVATDAALATYVTGQTFSSITTTAGAFQATFASNVPLPPGSNSFVVKFSSTGARSLATMLGSRFETANGIAVDATGAPYLIGTMNTGTINGVSSTTIGPGGLGDVMLAKFNNTLSALTYLVRIGGTNDEEGADGALDPGSNLFFTGRSVSSDLPSTPPSPGNTNVALFGAIDAAGTALTGPGLTWYGDATATSCTPPAFLVGNYGASIALDAEQRIAHVAGYGCPLSKFPVVNPLATIGCTPNCNADTNQMNSFLLRYRYPAPGEAKTSEDVTLESATPIAGASGTTTQSAQVVTDAVKDLYVGLTSSAPLPTKDAQDATQNGAEDVVLYKETFTLPPVITKQFEPDTIEAGGTTVLAITVTNPNDFPIKKVAINDQLPAGLQPYSGAGSFVVSDTPAGCNGKLGIYPWDRISTGLISNQYALADSDPNVYPVVPVAPPELPANFTCTVRFRIVDKRGDQAFYTNTTAAPTSESTVAGTPATATLTIQPAAGWTYIGGTGGSPFPLNNAANWNPNSIPAIGANVLFGPVAPANKLVNDNLAPLYPIGLFKVSDGGYTISGNELLIERSLSIDQPFTLNASVTFSDGSTVTVDAQGNVTASGTIKLQGAGTFTILNNGDFTSTGNLGGSGTIQIDGIGTVFLDGALAPGSSPSLVVGGGALQVNGNYSPTPVTLGPSGGSLGGIGSVGPVTNSSLLGTGNQAQPYGTLDILGNYSAPTGGSVTAFNADAQAMKPAGADATAVGTSSKLMVTGTASLGGTLVMNFDGLPDVGENFTVINAGAIAGRFARSRELPSEVFGEPTYSGTTVSYVVTSNTGIFRDGFE